LYLPLYFPKEYRVISPQSFQKRRVLWHLNSNFPISTIFHIGYERLLIKYMLEDFSRLQFSRLISNTSLLYCNCNLFYFASSLTPPFSEALNHLLDYSLFLPCLVAYISLVGYCYIPLHPTAGPDPIDSSAFHPAGLTMSPDHQTPQISRICPRSRSCSPSLLATYSVVGILTDVHSLRLSTYLYLTDSYF